MTPGKHNYPLKDGEPIYPPLVMPQGVIRETVTVWSDGVPLDADLYRPAGTPKGTRLPGVVLSHGWGGTKATTERYAAAFAARNMVALAFSQSGWGASGSRFTVIGAQPMDDAETEIRVQPARTFVDPVHWVQNFRAAVDYLVGEPDVDPARIGAWGTSFGGGIAVQAAATDTRIRAVAVQVSPLLSLQGPMRAHAEQRATAVARGELPPIPVGVDTMPNLTGSVHFAKALQFDILAAATGLEIPVQMLDAGNEEMFDPQENCGKAAGILEQRGAAPVRYEVIEGIDHYGIYFDGYARGCAMACDWFFRHLAG